MLDRTARHRDTPDGPPDARTAAVELLDVLRPTAAVSWFVAFGAHAPHRWPHHRDRLRAGDAAFATAFRARGAPLLPVRPLPRRRGRHRPGPARRDAAAGGIPLLDVHGQNHDEEPWGDPYAFLPRRGAERFLDRPIGADELIPQGGTDPAAGHRCPRERVTVGLLEPLTTGLARLTYTLPARDLSIPLRRVPTRPRDKVVRTGVRAPGV
ncbi:hypothetical protein [Streptomyces sp. NPDC090994]|uniref:hypothetical protein n=1 Tax=Streptomyces sp. NPDC090994 TaxID=3365969 RepID=UPI00381C40A1